MKVGILGAGNISDTHARAALGIPGVEIAAVCGTNREKAERMAAKYGGTAYDDLSRFLDHRSLDIVAIGTPSGVHAEQAIAAIGKGIHVLSEKPLDVTTAKVDSVVNAAERAGVKVGVFFQDRLKKDDDNEGKRKDKKETLLHSRFLLRIMKVCQLIYRFPSSIRRR